MDAAYLKSKHDAALAYAPYVQTGKPEQIINWNKIYEQAKLSAAQTQLVKSFTRKMNVIVLSGIWCGDCVQQCPLLASIAAGNPAKIDLRLIDRDQHADLQDRLVINAGRRVPVAVFCAEDYEFVSVFGDRTLSRYRAIAKRTLGPSCPLPGAAVDGDELQATLQEWLNEFERAHILLRLSARLRKLHGD